MKFAFAIILIASILLAEITETENFSRCSSHITRYECLYDSNCTWQDSTATCSDSGSDNCSGLLTENVCKSYSGCEWDSNWGRCYRR